jgi:hypothetical protein
LHLNRDGREGDLMYCLEVATLIFYDERNQQPMSGCVTENSGKNLAQLAMRSDRVLSGVCRMEDSSNSQAQSATMSGRVFSSSEFAAIIAITLSWQLR